MARARGFAAGRFALELDGSDAGWLQSAAGGDAEGDVVQEPVGADLVVRKHLASVRYTDIELGCGAGMNTAFYAWLAATIDHKYARKDGAVISVDASSKEVARLNFFNALVREIAFPALDASSKEPARLTVTVSPEYARRVKGGGTKVAGPGKETQKQWLPSNFRLQIAGVDCTRVSKVGAIVVTQKTDESAVGEVRDYEREPARLEIGDLVVTVAESHGADFVAWHDDFVVKGNNSSAVEKTGKLELLSPNMQTALFTLELKGLGIFKLVRDQGDAESLPKLRASIYCEELSFSAP